MASDGIGLTAAGDGLKGLFLAMTETTDWDRRFLALAAQVATWSKDPSTKAGAVIVDSERRIVSTGFNGFSRGIEDAPELLNDRAKKYRMILHAELNAILFAQRDLIGCTIYVHPMPPCAQCAAAIIQSGIEKVVTITPSAAHQKRWWSDWMIALQMYQQAGIAFLLLE